jgi:7-cyano-7-deazaguanine synthase
MLNRNSAIVLFSGGQDSTTCLYWAKQKFDRVVALSVFYGQKHSKEIECAREIAADAGVEFLTVDASFISSLSRNALTNDDIAVDENVEAGKIPNTFVPGRNLFFLSMAAVVARTHDIANIVTGVSQSDYSGYPDCRDTFIKSANTTINLSMDEQFDLHTPLMWLNKEQTWALADSLGVFDIIRDKTLTCYNGIIGEGCGNCPACKLRNKGLANYREAITKNYELCNERAK